jgi:hypothetical protein
LVAGPAGTIPQDLVGLRAKGVHEASVLKVLALSGAGGITEDEADHVVRKLRRDGLIMGPTRLKLDIFDDSTALTVRGRYEVEQWLAEPDEPTAALPLPANQVFHIENMHVTGTLMQGSTATNVNTPLVRRAPSWWSSSLSSGTFSLGPTYHLMIAKKSKPILR